MRHIYIYILLFYWQLFNTSNTITNIKYRFFMKLVFKLLWEGWSLVNHVIPSKLVLDLSYILKCVLFSSISDTNWLRSVTEPTSGNNRLPDCWYGWGEQSARLCQSNDYMHLFTAKKTELIILMVEIIHRHQVADSPTESTDVWLRPTYIRYQQEVGVAMEMTLKTNFKNIMSLSTQYVTLDLNFSLQPPSADTAASLSNDTAGPVYLVLFESEPAAMLNVCVNGNSKTHDTHCAVASSSGFSLKSYTERHHRGGFIQEHEQYDYKTGFIWNWSSINYFKTVIKQLNII